MPKPSESTFVGKIVKDPKKHVATLLLTGFLGQSSEKDHTRLYFDAQLSQYVEIPDQAILHSEPIPKEQSPLGGVYVWIDRDAQLVQGPAGTDRVKAKFFEGPIFQGFGALPAGSPLNAWTGYPWCGGNFTQDWRCPTPACPTAACPSEGAPCVSAGHLCPRIQTAYPCTAVLVCNVGVGAVPAEPLPMPLQGQFFPQYTAACPNPFHTMGGGCTVVVQYCQPIPLKTVAWPNCVTHMWPYC